MGHGYIFYCRCNFFFIVFFSGKAKTKYEESSGEQIVKNLESILSSLPHFF
jgi:hypothetical protein